MDVHIRWMIRKDMPEVIAIDEDCFWNPWDEKEWLAIARERATITHIAEYCDQVIGVMVVTLFKTKIELVKIMVKPGFQRQLVGDLLIAKLRGKMNPTRNRITTVVPDDNLGAHLFLRAMGFKATGIEDDFYLFELTKKGRVTA